MPEAKRQRTWKAYQRVVADIVGVLNPNASVKEGQWVQGPDGRRDLDVEIRGRREGRDILVVLECKDWKSPVGIAAVDALDSKRRDVGSDFAAICSNSGFSSPALRKALRKGIGMFSAVQRGNPAIRIAAYSNRYQCEINLLATKIIFHASAGDKTISDPDASLIYCLGSPFLNWLEHQIMTIVPENSNAEKIQLAITFRQPIEFLFGQDGLSINGLDIFLSLESTWFHNIVKVEPATGICDHLTRMMGFCGNVDIPVVIGNAPGKGVRIKQEKLTSEFMQELMPAARQGCCFVFFELNNSHKSVGDGTVPNLEPIIQRSEVRCD